MVADMTAYYRSIGKDFADFQGRHPAGLDGGRGESPAPDYGNVAPTVYTGKG